jgi:O-antigen/teichoic acid export membrane protein
MMWRKNRHGEKILDTFAVQFAKYKENKVVRNSFYGVIQFVVPTFLLLFFMPIFVHKMGMEQYGLWMLATSALGLMGMAEFGLNIAVSKFVAEFVGSKNNHALSAVISAGLVAYLLIGLGLIIPLYFCSPLIAGVFKPSTNIPVEQIGFVIQVMSLGFLPLLLRSGALAIPIGLQKFRIPVLVTVGYQVLSYSAALMVVYWGGSVVQVVESAVIVLWATALGSIVIAWRMLKPFELTFTLLHSPDVLRRMFSFSVISGVSGMGSQIFSVADRLAVGIVLGLDAVAYYSVIISVASRILQLSSALTNALMPAVSSWMASGEIRRVRSYFMRAMTAVTTLNFGVAFVLLTLSATLLQLWMGAEFAAHVLWSFRILIVIYALISLNAPGYFVAYGMDNPGINALVAILGGCLTIGLILIWGKPFGLLGAALANGGYLITFAISVFVYLRINSTVRQTLSAIA